MKIGYGWLFLFLNGKYKVRPGGSHKKATGAIRGGEAGDLPGARRRCSRSRRSVGLVIGETR